MRNFLIRFGNIGKMKHFRPSEKGGCVCRVLSLKLRFVSNFPLQLPRRELSKESSFFFVKFLYYKVDTPHYNKSAGGRNEGFGFKMKIFGL